MRCFAQGRLSGGGGYGEVSHKKGGHAYICALVSLRFGHGLKHPEWDGAIGRRRGALLVGHGAERLTKVGVVAE